MPTHPSGHPPNGQPVPPGSDRNVSVEDLIAEAETLRELLQQAQAKLARLTAGFKQQRKQSRAVAAAVASLRNLPPLGP